MSADVPASHAIFMVAALIAATAVGGAMISIAFTLSNDLADNSERLSDVMLSDIVIVNDEASVPYSGGVLYIYVLNCGETTLGDDWIVIVDGNIMAVDDYTVSNLNDPGEPIAPEDIAVISVTVALTGTDHSTKVLYSDMAEDRMEFRL